MFTPFRMRGPCSYLLRREPIVRPRISNTRPQVPACCSKFVGSASVLAKYEPTKMHEKTAMLRRGPDSGNNLKQCLASI